MKILTGIGSRETPREILEDLLVVCLQGQTLADKVLRLNPKSEEMGARTQPRPRAIGQRGWPQRCGRSAGMLANLQEIAGKITKIY